ncbi:TetR/AcrR family transcriptional regulator [Promicromonospora sukumoe]|uniref:TetR/AcrR family transcriptional regulator n=1 Tax=Promicromonospora sukumoe TaxID=88382 RepID=UPI0037CB50BD
MNRPKVPILSLDRIADAALTLVEHTGDVQMVQLAKHLGVAPSSLYSHVTGRAEVIDLARLRMLESMEPQEPVTDWRIAVERLLRQLAGHYAQHTKLLPLIFSTPVSHERAIAIYEPVFTALLDDGFRPDLLRLVIALVEAQALGLALGLPTPVMSDEIRATLPSYTKSIDHSRYDRDSSTDFAADVIIRGLEQLRNTQSDHRSTRIPSPSQ